jgi:outer membrane protein assembly factor BamD (BamD/ComL family)
MRATRVLIMTFSAAGVFATGCGRQLEPAAEARLASALESIQQGRLDEASRSLSAIRSGGGWLKPAMWSAPLALRLRAAIALKVGAQDEMNRLFRQYDRLYGDLAPAAYVRSRMEFLSRFRDWQGVPALLFLKGLEAEEEAPALAIREWRGLLHNYPNCAIAPTVQLRLGLLQARLDNAAWALSELAPVARMPLSVVDPRGNPVAPLALLAIGVIQRDLMHENGPAREALEAVGAQFGKLVLKGPGDDGEPAYLPAVMAQFELAVMASDGGAQILDSLVNSPPPYGYVTEDRVGDVRAEARLRLAEINLRRRNWERARERLVEIVRLTPDAVGGPPGGARRWYGFTAIDALEEKLGARSPEDALAGLDSAAQGARHREIWAWAQLRKIRLLARIGRQEDAKAVLAEMERRFPNMDLDPDGDGLLLVPVREAKRLLGLLSS